MTKDKVKESLFWKINDVFAEYQESVGAETGDITPWQLIELEDLEDKIVDLIIEVGNQNVQKM